MEWCGLRVDWCGVEWSDFASCGVKWSAVNDCGVG